MKAVLVQIASKMRLLAMCFWLAGDFESLNGNLLPEFTGLDGKLKGPTNFVVASKEIKMRIIDQKHSNKLERSELKF